MSPVALGWVKHWGTGTGVIDRCPGPLRFGVIPDIVARS